MSDLFKPFDEIEWMMGEYFEIVRRAREIRRNAEKNLLFAGVSK